MTTQHFSPLIPGADCYDISKCGGKAFGLSRAARVVRVPPFFVVPTDWFDAACADLLPALDEICLRLAHDGGSRLDEVEKEVDGLFSGVMLRTSMQELLAAAVGELGGTRSFAVRSSATTEDGRRSAEAGLYDSVLNVGPAEVAAAVIRCWASAYSSRALWNKLRRGVDVRPEIAVIVQPMVAAEQAGIAFSAGPDHVVVERVWGLAADLVGGRVAPENHVVIGSASDVGSELQFVREAVLGLRTLFGGEVDVEWVWDGELVYVVQARDVTSALPIALVPEERTDLPVLRTAELYGPAGDVRDLNLGSVAEVYASYRRKRLGLNEVAGKHGCASGTAIVLRCNQAGLASSGWEAIMARFGRQVVADAGPDARQMIVPIEDLKETLLAALRASANPDTPITVLVREFTAGDIGAISHVTESGLHVEWSPDGLLAINRGIATSLYRFVERGGATTGRLPDGWNSQVVGMVRSVTLEFAERGDCLIEWVSEGDKLKAIDYSAVGGAFASDVFERAMVISGGSCRGPALVINDGMFDNLKSTSVAPVVSVSEALPLDGTSHISELYAQVLASPEPPIVVVDRPFAILAVLIGSVAGFVFSGEASLLCHLSILLREHGVPAVSAPGFEIEQGRGLKVLDSGEVRAEALRA